MSGLILPPGGRQPSPEPAFEPYDSEIIRIGEVMDRLNVMRQSPMNPEDFYQAGVDMFHKAGIVADIVFYEAADERGQLVPGVWVPEVVLKGRVDEKHEFDWDRQVHEVTNDILGLGEGGVISTKKMKPGA